MVSLNYFNVVIEGHLLISIYMFLRAILVKFLFFLVFVQKAVKMLIDNVDKVPVRELFVLFFVLLVFSMKNRGHVSRCVLFLAFSLLPF